MKPIIGYKPLRNVLNALEQGDDELTTEQLKESLRDRGFDPDKLVKDVKEKVAQGLKQQGQGKT